MTIGDVNGIGMELIIDVLSDNRILKEFTPIVYGSSQIASLYRKQLQKEDFSFFKIKDASEARNGKPNLIEAWKEDVEVEMGKATEVGGRYAVKSLESAVAGLVKNDFDVLVTGPFNKEKIQGANFEFPGHTEYLAKMSNVDQALMLMVHEGLRVAVHSGHIPLKDASAAITTESVLTKIELLSNSLQRDFLVNRPKIAVMGFNPHAGEKGLLGDEEDNHIVPAIRAAKEKDIMVFGPYSADGFFGSGNFKNFDGILAMYHDQGLIPFKALSGGAGVNYTAGLPIVRTSPAHGTAYDLVGKRSADPASFRNACYMACQIYRNRKQYKDMNANPLEVSKPKEGRS